MACMYTLIAVIVGFAIFLKLLLMRALEPKKMFVFDKQRIHEIIKGVLAKYEAEDPEERLGYKPPTKPTPGKQRVSMSELFNHVARAMKKEYPEWITWDENPKKQEWMHVNVGGTMGQMIILHCSFSEYIMFFGTPLGTEGHSGRYFYDCHDYILRGRHDTYEPGEIDGATFRPGEVTHLIRGSACGYRSERHTYMLEYGHGLGILLAGFWPLVSVLFNTLDFVSFIGVIGIYGKHMIRNLLKGKI
eukprot:GEZU01029217.1.p1 GENE.GEZU01029217.1~~GEZU01029217.1.p1  ORF type:complete len:246 (-),score=99.35 GEZU01029217.1:96-833(-)